jgi:hypothetical protein
MFAGIAIVTWLYTQPEMSRMAEFEIGWIAHIFAGRPLVRHLPRRQPGSA